MPHAQVALLLDSSTNFTISSDSLPDKSWNGY